MTRFVMKDRMLDGGDWHLGYRRVRKNPFHGPPHRHQGFHELMLGISGSTSNIVRDEQKALRSGFLIFVGEQTLHQVSGSECEWLNIAFADHYLLWVDETFHAHGSVLALPHQAPAPSTQLDTKHLAFIIDRTRKMESAPQGQDDAQFRLLIADLLLALATQKQNQPALLEPAWLRTAIQQFESLPVHEWTRDTLCQLTGRSEEYLCRVMRSQLNCSPTDYINRLRLEYAADCLRNDETIDYSHCPRCWLQ